MSSQGSSGIAAESRDSETDQKLRQWGEWSRTGHQLPTCNSMFILGSTVASPIMTDDEALRVDQAVAQVRLQASMTAKVLRLYYITGKSISATSKIIRRSRGQTQNLLENGRSLVSGYLSGRLPMD